MQPWLSVLIPTLNGGDFLRDSLASIAGARDPDIECIVVDGGSSDDTLAVLEAHRSRLNLTVLERPGSPGWVWSTNLALSMATAPHASLLHQDDTWLPARARQLRALIKAAPDVTLFVHDARYIDANGRRVGRLSCPWSPWPVRLRPQEAIAALLVQNFIAAPATSFRVDQARACGGLDETLWYSADWDLWLKMASRGPVAYVPEELAAFRLHSESQTIKRSRDDAAFLQQMEVVLDRHISQLEHGRSRESVERAARFSNRLNAAMAFRSHGGAPDWRSLLRTASKLRPGDWSRFLRHSRIASRVGSRLRARALPR
jgi:glycosyltransferase involved in cell wall biosynthesis